MYQKLTKYLSSPMALLCVFAMLLSVAYKAEAETEFTPKIKETMVAIQAEAAKLGEPRIEGVSLFFGSTKINGNYQIVDDLKTKFGCTATFFVKKGDKYIRISTNVLKDGNRAVGTILDPKGAAMTAINKGEAFYGVVDIIGSQYDTGYTPIKNSAGETLGIYYIGYKLK